MGLTTATDTAEIAPDHSPPQALSTPLCPPTLAASLVAAKVMERREQMVLEQLVSSCPRETIGHLPLCVLSLPRAPSAPRHGIIGTSYWILAWRLEGQEGEGFNNCVTENTEVMSPVKPAVDFGRGPIFPTCSGLTVKGGITPAHHLLWDHTARTHQ